MKRNAKIALLACVSLILIFQFPISNCAEAQPNRPKVAVVLSGGGAKGMAHISALRVIEEAGIPIDIVCGTSMGSLIGALYCIGYSTDQLDSLVHAQDWTALLSDRTDARDLTLRQRQEQNTYLFIRGINSERQQQGGLIRGRNLMRLFRQLCAGYLDSISFDSLPIPFACVATDIATNSEVDFRNGYLVRAMRASMAIPGVFTPVVMGDSILVDGGLRNNYPADLARRMGADIVIGVSVQNDALKPEQIGNAISILMQMVDINTKNKFEENMALSDVMIRVNVDGYNAASFTSTAVDSLLARGDRAARQHWDELLALRRRHGIDSLPLPAKSYCPPDSLYPIFRPRPVSIPVASAGFRFDSEEMGAVQLDFKYPIRTPVPMGLEGTLRLGRRIMARAEYSLFTSSGFTPTTSYTFRNNDIDIYTRGRRTHNIRYMQHTTDLSPVDFRLRLLTLHAGIRWDYFNFYGQLLTSDYSNAQVEDGGYFTWHSSADINTEDDWYFPSRGFRFHTSYDCHTSNLIGLNGGFGLNDLYGHLRVNLPLSRRLTFQPLLYSRFLFGNTTPLPYCNSIGGEYFGHFEEHQMPFAGIGHMELLQDKFLAAQLQFQYQIFPKHYLILRMGAYISHDRFDQLFLQQPTVGFQAGYSFNSIIGPADLRIGYSLADGEPSRRPYFCFNIGHIF